MPKVSVIIPNYNHAQYLRQRIDSVLAQNFKDYELILLDDASTDNSTEIITDYASRYPQVKCFINSTNSGSPFAQWNKGAELAQGEYLWFAESDDYCEPNLLDALVPMLDDNPKVGIAYCQTYLVNEQNEILNSYQKNLEFIFKSDAWENSFEMDGRQVCRDWLLFHNPIPNASGALMRRSVYMDAGMGDTGMKLNGDWYLYSRMMALSDLAFNHAILNYFRVHPATQRERARVTPDVYFEIIKINEFIKEHVPGSSENAEKAIRKVSTWWQGNLYYHHNTKENRRKNRQLYQYFKKHRNYLFLHIVYTYIIEITRDFLRWTGLLKPAKKIRSKLFPGKYFEY